VPRTASAAARYIGARLAEVRADRAGITQDQLAALTGIDSSNIRAYESGRAMPSIHTLVRIATALDIAPGELIDGLEPEAFGEPRRKRGRGAA